MSPVSEGEEAKSCGQEVGRRRVGRVGGGGARCLPTPGVDGLGWRCPHIQPFGGNGTHLL